MEVAQFEGRTYFFIGNQRVSTLMIYSIADSSEEILPVFEGLHRAGGTNKTWTELFEDRNVGDLNFQDMK